jgi:hypothetical protein
VVRVGIDLDDDLLDRGAGGFAAADGLHSDEAGGFELGEARPVISASAAIDGGLRSRMIASSCRFSGVSSRAHLAHRSNRMWMWRIVEMEVVKGRRADRQAGGQPRWHDLGSDMSLSAANFQSRK